MSTSYRLFIAILSTVFVSTLACESNPFPKANVEVRVEEGRFFPKDLDIPPGTTVRWVNILPKSEANVRTVTSGAPSDSTAGSLFDETLQGRELGEVEGDDFIYRFGERGTFPYFSRFPESPRLQGTVLVR